MKILTAKAKDNSGTNICYRALVPIAKLHPIIKWGWHPDNYQDIITSIREHGLDHPLVVWETTVAEWLKMSNAQPEDIIGPPMGLNRNPSKPVLLVMCGNNRLNSAKELGYDYIDVIICKEREEVSKRCSAQRKDWRVQRPRRFPKDSQQQ